jgi:hypothetical protein
MCSRNDGSVAAAQWPVYNVPGASRLKLRRSKRGLNIRKLTPLAMSVFELLLREPLCGTPNSVLSIHIRSIFYGICLTFINCTPPFPCSLPPLLGKLPTLYLYYNCIASTLHRTDVYYIYITSKRHRNVRCTLSRTL